MGYIFDLDDIVKSIDNRFEGVITDVKVDENNNTIYAVYDCVNIKWFLAKELTLAERE